MNKVKLFTLLFIVPFIGLTSLGFLKNRGNFVLTPHLQQIHPPESENEDIDVCSVYDSKAIYVISDLAYRSSRPYWWPHEGMNMLRSLSFVSGTIEDSKGQNISVQERSGYSELNEHLPTTPARNPYVPEIDSLRLRSLLIPTAPVDLSQGGKITLTLNVKENEYDASYDPNASPYWQGTYTIALPPLPENFHIEQAKIK